MGRSKRKGRRAQARMQQPAETAQAAEMSGLYEAARFNRYHLLQWFAGTNPRQEVSNFDRAQLVRLARSLYANSPEARMIVKTCELLIGSLMPMPCSGNKEWDKLAYDVFMRRAMNPVMFEASGRLNWKQMQAWLVRRALIDGDALVALGIDRYDNGAQVRLYQAPDVDSPLVGVEDGCKVDARGRITAYYIGEQKIDARRAILYNLSPDPWGLRGASEIAGAILNLLDVKELNDLLKQVVKTAASVAYVETKPENDRNPDALRAIGRRLAGESACLESSAGTVINGIQAYSPPPGRKIELLTDHRPTPEVQKFSRELVRSAAYNLGIDPEVVFYTYELGSAAVRLNLEKTRRWTAEKYVPIEAALNRIYWHVLSQEVIAGRLQACPAGADWRAVRWIAPRDMSIDIGRIANNAISLIERNLMSADDWCLATVGQTYAQTAVENARALQLAREQCAAENLPLPDMATPLPQSSEPSKTETENE